MREHGAVGRARAGQGQLNLLQKEGIEEGVEHGIRVRLRFVTRGGTDRRMYMMKGGGVTGIMMISWLVMYGG